MVCNAVMLPVKVFILFVGFTTSVVSILYCRALLKESAKFNMGGTLAALIMYRDNENDNYKVHCVINNEWKR